VFNLAANYMALGQTNRARELLDGVLNHPQVESGAVLAVAQAYSSMQDYPKLEVTLEKLVELSPTQPEAWYDLAAIKAFLGKAADCLPPLRQALNMSAARLKTNRNERDLRVEALKDPRFFGVHSNADFQALLAKP
jgi:tetratricopeptide (TPR) repeat protein